jgi:hypothetical protein
MNAAAYTPIAVLSFPRKDSFLIPFAGGILDALTGNVSFPDPRPTLLAFEAHIDAYAKAQALAMKRGQGAATQRDARRRKVMADLNHLRDYVQRVVETETSAEDAAAMIVSAGMRVKKVATRDKPAIRATRGATSGMAVLDARAVAAVAMYYWQYSLNQVDWINVPEMMKSRAVITGLTPLSTYYFRFRATTRKGPLDPSPVVSLVVL